PHPPSTLPRSPRTPRSTLFPYTTLFRSRPETIGRIDGEPRDGETDPTRRSGPSTAWRTRRRRRPAPRECPARRPCPPPGRRSDRSEEHTSELQSRENLVCRLLLEKKNQD